MKKNILFIALGLIIGSVTLTGCKKGENDPFLSLKSRDARITANWKLVKVESSDVSTDPTGTDTYTNTYDGTTMSSAYNGTTYSTYSYSLSVEILKDGTYVSTEVVDGDTETVNGRWVWMNAAKNKTMISLDNLGTFEVNGLKSKELMLKVYSKDVAVSGGATTTDESTATWTFEKQK
ncbi:MAG: hypothetical protein ACK50Y_01340 [Flavobacteriia bacterium]